MWNGSNQPKVSGGAAGWKFGATVDDGLGSGISSGDFNLDGHADVALGATWADPLGRTNAGTVYMLHGLFVPTGILHPPTLSPTVLLKQNWPNPFSRTTLIEYELPRSAPMALSIYDVRGQLVRQVAQGVRPAGQGFVNWDGIDRRGRRVASGVYFYRLKAGPFFQTKKMLLIR
ncbi:MAG: FlgD immunoglobulin-like domain containing protein [Candidatus Krumholzibacteriia bacterium]